MEGPTRYERPRNCPSITKTDKLALLKEYTTEYEALAKADPSALNRKISREAFSAVLDAVGVLLTEKWTALAASPGLVQQWIDICSADEPASCAAKRSTAAWSPETSSAPASNFTIRFGTGDRRYR